MNHQQHILEFLEGKGSVMCGLIEDHMRQEFGIKGGTTSRLCRFLVQEGKLEPNYTKVEGVGRPCVAYSVKSPQIHRKVINHIPFSQNRPETQILRNNTLFGDDYAGYPDANAVNPFHSL